MISHVFIISLAACDLCVFSYFLKDKGINGSGVFDHFFLLRVDDDVFEGINIVAE